MTLASADRLDILALFDSETVTLPFFRRDTLTGNRGKHADPPRSRRAGRRVWIWFLVLVMIAVSLRLVYLSRILDAPDMLSPELDSSWHKTEAMRIAGGRLLPDAPLWRAPAYQYFLAPLFLLSKGDTTLPRTVQVLLSGVTCGLIFLLGLRVFNRKAGIIAGLLACGYQMHIYFSTELLAVTFEVFVNTILLLMILRANERSTTGAWFAAGTLLGFSAVVRPNILVFAVFLFLFVLGWKKWRSNLRAALSLTAGTLLLVLPVTALNVIQGGDRVLIAYQGGPNFYIGNGPHADGRTVIVPGGFEQEYSHRLNEYQCQVQMMSDLHTEREMGRELKPSEQDRFWYTKTFQYIAKEPASFLCLLTRKLYYFWNSFEVSNNRDIRTFLEEYSPWMRVPLPWFGLVAPLALAGILISRRTGRNERLLLLFLAAQMLSVLLFFVCARYRMSAVIVLLLFAGFLLERVWDEIRRGDWRRTAITAAIVAPLLWFSHTGFFGVKNVFDANTHSFNEALALLQSGQIEKAIAAITPVADAHPRDPAIQSTLGTALLRAGRYEEALERFDRALAVQPEMGAIIHSDIGAYLASKGRLDEAETEFRAAIRVDPGFMTARMNLAGILTNSGRPEEALGHFEEVIRIAPEQANVVLIEMSVALDRLGRREEAVTSVRNAIEQNGTNARAHAILAGFLEEAGDLDGARREWNLAKDWAAGDPIRKMAEERLEALR